MRNGKLFYNDHGRMLENRNEEIAYNAWIKKDFQIDLVDPQESSLSLFVYEYKENETPLCIRINGETYLINPKAELQGFFRWRTVVLPAGTARTGHNEVQISSDNIPFHSWIVAVDNGNRSGASAKSYDQALTWTSERLGYDYSLSGEYIIRWYVAENPKYEVTQTLVHQVLQPLDHPDLQRFRIMENLDRVCQGAASDYDKAASLCSWVAEQWVHCGGLMYPPSHLPTLLTWRRRKEGHGYSDVRGFCVLFANAFIQACWAMGLYARGVALQSYTGKGPDGHFVAEVYCKELGKWVMFDPDFDVQLEYRHQPLHTGEMSDLWARGEAHAVKIVKGRAFGNNPIGLDFFSNHLLSGGYRFIAVHCNQDYISRPDHQMVNHGAVLALDYHEPEMIIYDRTKQYATIFPYVTNDLNVLYFNPTSLFNS